MMMIFVRLTKSCCVVSFRPNLMQDSLGFWIPRYGIWTPGTESWIAFQWDLDSGFQSLVGFGDSRFQSLEGLRILWAGFLRVVSSSQETKWQLTYISSTEEYQFMLPMFDFWRYCPGSGSKCWCRAYLRAALIYVLFVKRFATLCKEMHEMFTRPW